MSEPQEKLRLIPFPPDIIDGLLAAAARAPSILNTQPWQFRVTATTIELFADPHRKLHCDLTGREMLISCGAALFGLRLAIRAIGYQPAVRLLPDPLQTSLLAKVQLGNQVPMTEGERRMFGALPRRHTHRHGYAPGPLPRGLLIGLQHDAVAEHAALALIDRPAAFTQLAGIVARAAVTLNADARSRADISHWVRPPESDAEDGIPGSAITMRPYMAPGWLVQRELDNGRRIGSLEADCGPPAATAVLLTSADTRADWLRAGQALHRILVHAATQWVFATLYSQALESPPARAMISSKLGLPGAPQLILQLGLARTTRPTARRAPELIKGHAQDRDDAQPSATAPGTAPA